jgi:subtilisin family serine protease
VVSTFPADADGSQQPSVETFVRGDGERATIDPDDFTRRMPNKRRRTGGFGTWSGTSFSAPLVAGEIAQALFATGLVWDLEQSVAKGWNAVHDVVGLSVPSS